MSECAICEGPCIHGDDVAVTQEGLDRLKARGMIVECEPPAWLSEPFDPAKLQAALDGIRKALS